MWSPATFIGKKNKNTVEPKEIASCLIPFLNVLVVFTRQLEILVTALINVVIKKTVFFVSVLMDAFTESHMRDFEKTNISCFMLDHKIPDNF